MSPEMKSYNFKAHPQDVEAAMKLAKSNGENLSVVIRRALIQYVKENQS